MNSYTNPTLNYLPDEMIVELCNQMNISQLKNFIQTATRNYDICHDVLQEKLIIAEMQRKLKIKHKILSQIDALKLQTRISGNSTLFDISQVLTSNGRVLMFYRYPGIENIKITIPGYPNIIVDKSLYDQAVNIMTTPELH